MINGLGRPDADMAITTSSREPPAIGGDMTAVHLEILLLAAMAQPRGPDDVHVSGSRRMSRASNVADDGVAVVLQGALVEMAEKSLVQIQCGELQPKSTSQLLSGYGLTRIDQSSARRGAAHSSCSGHSQEGGGKGSRVSAAFLE